MKTNYENTLINGECLVELNKIKNDSVDLVILDPPYNVTDHYWDKFKTEEDYLNFLGELIFQSSRVLKETGSLYVFHSKFESLCKIQNLVENNTGLSYKRLITWNKSFEGCSTEHLKWFALQRDLNNYPAYCEYILFYGFENPKKLETIYTDKENFSNYKNYIESVLNKKKLNSYSKKIVKLLYEGIGYKSMQSAQSISYRLFERNFKNFGIITKKQYDVLNPLLNFDLSYDEILEIAKKDKMNATLPLEKTLSSTVFNNQHTHHSIWNYDAPKNLLHPTQKPLNMIKNIIIHSSNEGGVVLDPCMGVGTTCKAAKETGRKYIGIEKDIEYFNIAVDELR